MQIKRVGCQPLMAENLDLYRNRQGGVYDAEYQVREKARKSYRSKNSSE